MTPRNGASLDHFPRDECLNVGPEKYATIPGDGNMHSGDVALRLSSVVAVASFIVLAASIYEIDRREKSSSETVTANFTEFERRIQILSDQNRILGDQYAGQIDANERELHSLNIQVQTIESRLNALEEELRVGRQRRP